MDVLIFQDFGNPDASGYELAQTLSPEPPASQPDRLKRVWKCTNYQEAEKAIRRNIQKQSSGSFSDYRLSKKQVDGWTDVYFAYWRAVGDILAADAQDGASSKLSWTKVYGSWKEMTLSLVRGYTNCDFEAWTIPCLYVAGKYLRTFAIKADAERNSTSVDNTATTLQDDFDPDSEKNQQLEDCARQLNRIFTLCLGDRATNLLQSRKLGTYYIAVLLFKTYFRLNSASLSRNILKAIASASVGEFGLPKPIPENGDPQIFPKSHVVAFKYYEGVLAFLDENYVEAEKHLTIALNDCHKDAKKNKELILTYLIPCHLLTTHTLPTAQLLEPYPRLQKLFLPLARCIKKGDLHGFDLALMKGEEEFVKRRIYLTLERGRDVALRNLLRKVFIAGGYEDPKEPGATPLRRTRVPVAEFVAAISLGSQQAVDTDEVECLLANMIYKNLMKGYIARERGIVVLSKAGAFPGTGV